MIPSFADWARAIRPEPWMGRTQRIERDVDPAMIVATSDSAMSHGEDRP